jgi:hypothetical protein
MRFKGNPVDKFFVYEKDIFGVRTLGNIEAQTTGFLPYQLDMRGRRAEVALAKAIRIDGL